MVAKTIVIFTILSTLPIFHVHVFESKVLIEQRVKTKIHFVPISLGNDLCSFIPTTLCKMGISLYPYAGTRMLWSVKVFQFLTFGVLYK